MSPARTFVIVALLLTLFAGLAGWAVSRTSCTYDETLHIAAAYVIRHTADFRVNPEDPPLFERWAGLALPRGALTPDYSAKQWDGMLTNLYDHWPWVNAAIFGGPKEPVPPGALGAISAARGMMLPVAVGLGIATAALAWGMARRRAGVAAIVATTLFALDPTALGHASLVKNDIVLALAFALTALALARLWDRVTWGWACLLVAGPAFGVATKFTGLLLGPAVVLALAARVMAPSEWGVFSRVSRTRARRACVAAALVVACMLGSWAGVWAVYGFRYALTPLPGQPDVLAPEVFIAQTNTLFNRKPGMQHLDSEIMAEPVPSPIRAMKWAGEHRLVPQAFAKGFDHTYASTLTRYAFLFDEISETGWWYYFPAVLAMKLPAGTVAMLLGSMGVGAWTLRRVSVPPITRERRLWNGRLVGPGIIVAFYFATAMSGNLNLGIRHLLPILPIGFALAGVAAARVWDQPWARIACFALLGATAVEVGFARGNYLAFFNVGAQKAASPEHLLADSCLDWSQDLPALVEWQQAHPATALSLAYFGTATPEAYGLRYTPLQGTEYSKSEVSTAPPLPGVVAITATQLQSVYLKPSERGVVYELFRRLKPRDVLRGTIFLYDWPPGPEALAWSPWTIYVRVGRETYPLPPLPQGPVQGAPRR